ncbi:MAG: hypothetical protein ABSF18_01355 [Gammaproteobacteria bacterium]
MKFNIKPHEGYKILTYDIEPNLRLVAAYDDEFAQLPANGGLRMREYKSVEAQEAEALILAQQMSKKHKLYNTGFTGVKLVAHGKVTPENKIKILNAAAEVLNYFKGKIYTGCDMNISNQDMEYLTTMSKYVLSGLGSQINTSFATAYGVYAALMAVIHFQHLENKKHKILVHGIGKLGSVLVNKLLADGHEVYTYDARFESANVNGAINISQNNNWYETPCDYLVLCSFSGVITEEIARKLNCSWVVSGANAPFATSKVPDILFDKKISWLPDVVSNSGAVVCDVLEFLDRERYIKIDPQIVYDFVYQVTFKKTETLLGLAKKYNLSPYDVLHIFFSIEWNDNILNIEE